MTNLWTDTVTQNGQYQNLATLSGLTFSEGVTYTIQIQNMAYIREGSMGGGFIITTNKPFSWVASNNDLFIKPLGETCVVNIAN